MSEPSRIGGWRWAGRIYLVLLTAFSVVPMVWMALTSIKTQFAALQYPPQWWPAEPTIEQYTTLLNPTSDVGREFLTYLWNSLWICSVTTFIGVAVAVPAAYAQRRASAFPVRIWLFAAGRCRGTMLPAVVFLMPLFILMRKLHLVNSGWSLVLSYLTFGLPLSIWLLKGFYDNIPVQLEQAARIDGATRFEALFHVVLPLSSHSASSPRRFTPSSSAGTNMSTPPRSSTTRTG